ncbi:MAG: hypothetical protein JWQ35_583 [Bacteriovoracaceae bacterium]|nr:hypothetical protein [Bacteriovoracaceae bacterium]
MTIRLELPRELIIIVPPALVAAPTALRTSNPKEALRCPPINPKYKLTDSTRRVNVIFTYQSFFLNVSFT